MTAIFLFPWPGELFGKWYPEMLCVLHARHYQTTKRSKTK
jgi:hypothetical protein